MYLPCPHCRKIFRVDPGLLQADAVRLRCPACSGRFLVQKNEHIRLPGAGTVLSSCETGDFAAPSSSSVRERRRPDEPCAPSVGPGSPGRKEDTPGSGDRAENTSRFRPPSGVLWLLLPAFGLLLAMVGILMPVAGTDRLFLRQDGFVPSEARQERTMPNPASQEHKDRSAPETDPMGLSLLLGLGLVDPCQAAIAAEPGKEESREARLCRLYPYWICFLSAPSSAGKSACQVDVVFSETAEALRSNSLCAEAHAFLAAYYIQKRVADRGQSCLEEARKAGRGCIWPKWAEVLYALRIDKDEARAEALLVDLLKDFPGFPLGRYCLARLQIERERYDQARQTLDALQESGPQQTELAGIRQTLDSIETSSYYSAERAAGLVSLARSFSSLGEAETAERLLRRVLEGMPGRLPPSEEKAAFIELGGLQENRGDKEGAYGSYRNAIQIDPLCTEAKERLRRLTVGGRESS